MAIYRVQAPDGSILRIEGPDNAKPEEIEAFAAQQFSPKKPAEKPAPDDPGAVMAGVIGMGRTLDRLGKGVKQMGLNVGSAFGSDAAKAELGKMAEQEAENTRLYEPLTKQRPVATMVGEAAPLLAAPMVGTGALSMAASAALPGLVEYGTTGERLSRAGMGATGGVMGNVAGKVLSRAVKPTASLSQAQQGAIDAADRLGVKLTSGEASGNRALKWAEAAAADVPGASGIASSRFAANDKAIARAASRAIGQNADEVTDAVFSAARQQISSEFDRILTPLKIDLANKTTQAELKAVTGSNVMKSLRDEGVDKILLEIDGLSKIGPVDGAWFQQNKTALDMAIRSAYNTGKPGEAKALEGIEKALDNAAKRQMGKANASAYEAARKQWANLRMLETGKVVDEGRVLPGRLKSAMETRYKGAMKRGQITGELADIAKLANTLRAPPQSGTVPRAFYTGAGLMGAIANPAATAVAFGAPALLQGITASPAMRNYLTKGAVNLTPEMERLLQLGGGRIGLLGAYGATN